MRWFYHFLKALNVLIALLGTCIYLSENHTKRSLQTLLMMIFINILLLFSLLYSIYRVKILKSKTLSFLFFFLESHKVTNGKVMTLHANTLIFIMMSALVSSTLISFSSEVWQVSYFLITIPGVYLLHLLGFSLNHGIDTTLSDNFRMPLVYSLLLIEGICLLMFSEVDFFDSEAFMKIVAVLACFGVLLCVVLYELSMVSRISKVLATLETVAFFGILAAAAIDGSKDKNKEVIEVCLFLACLIPMLLISSSVYARFDISSEVKNSMFLVVWTLFYVPAVSLASSYSEGHKTVANIVNFSILSIGLYLMVFEIFCRFMKITKREEINSIISCSIIIPLGTLICLLATGQISSIIAIILIIFVSCSNAFILIFYLVSKILKKNPSIPLSTGGSKLLLEKDTLTFTFSNLWKFIYLLSVCFLTSIIFLGYDNSESSNLIIPTQGLLTLISGLAHSVLLENVNFFVLETDHNYPSMRKIGLFDKVIPSVLQKAFERSKRKYQIIIFIFFIIFEIISLACIAYSKNTYFIIIFNLVTAVFFIIAFEVKLKTWKEGKKLAAELLVLIWTSIYVPCVCGYSVISNTSNSGEISSSSSLMVSFIIVSFCINIGLISGELYENNTSYKRAYMTTLLKTSGFSMNFRNFIIEDYENRNLQNFEIIVKGNKSYEEYLSKHSDNVCLKCQEGKDHETPPEAYEYKHYKLLRTLMLKPSAYHYFVKQNSIKKSEKNQINTKNQTFISDDQVITLQELFKIRPDDLQVKKFNFVNVLAQVYREKINRKLITRDDFFMVYLKVTHDISYQVLQNFDKNFFIRILEGLAKLIYKKVNKETIQKVKNDLLGSGQGGQVIEQEPSQIFPFRLTARACKTYLKANITVKNALDCLIPYSLINLIIPIENTKTSSIQDFLEELGREPDKFSKDFIDSTTTSLSLIYFASFVNMYSLTSVALTKEIDWVESKLPLSTGVVPSEKNWLVSVILSFSLIFLFFLVTFILFLLIRLKTGSAKIITNLGKSFMIVVASGMLVENLIFLLSNLMCQSTKGKLHMQNNEEIKCFSSTHIILLSISIPLFVVYFFLAQVFYPSFHKLSSRNEHYFNIEIHCKLIYSAIASCVSNDLLGFKLALCLFLGIVLVFYSRYRIMAEDCDMKKFQQDTKEYFIVICVYVLALFVYYEVGIPQAFFILVAVIVGYSIYGFFKFFNKIRRFFTALCFREKNSVLPRSAEDYQANDLLQDEDRPNSPVDDPLPEDIKTMNREIRENSNQPTYSNSLQRKSEKNKKVEG